MGSDAEADVPVGGIGVHERDIQHAEDRAGVPVRHTVHVAADGETGAGSYADRTVYPADQRRDHGGDVLPAGPPVAGGRGN